MSAAVGCSVPVPFLRIFDASPDLDLSASAGAAATSLGAGMSCALVMLSEPNAIRPAKPAAIKYFDLVYFTMRKTQ